MMVAFLAGCGQERLGPPEQADRVVLHIRSKVGDDALLVITNTGRLVPMEILQDGEWGKVMNSSNRRRLMELEPMILRGISDRSLITEPLEAHTEIVFPENSGVCAFDSVEIQRPEHTPTRLTHFEALNTNEYSKNILTLMRSRYCKAESRVVLHYVQGDNHDVRVLKRPDGSLVGRANGQERILDPGVETIYQDYLRSRVITSEPLDAHTIIHRLPDGTHSIQLPREASPSANMSKREFATSEYYKRIKPFAINRFITRVLKNEKIVLDLRTGVKKGFYIILNKDGSFSHVFRDNGLVSPVSETLAARYRQVQDKLIVESAAHHRITYMKQNEKGENIFRILDQERGTDTEYRTATELEDHEYFYNVFPLF